MGQQAGAGLPTPKDIHRQSDNRKNDENSHKIHGFLLFVGCWRVRAGPMPSAPLRLYA